MFVYVSLCVCVFVCGGGGAVVAAEVMTMVLMVLAMVLAMGLAVGRWVAGSQAVRLSQLCNFEPAVASVKVEGARSHTIAWSCWWYRGHTLLGEAHCLMMGLTMTVLLPDRT